MIKTFSEFINEDYTYSHDMFDEYVMEQEWYYYEPDDEILFGSGTEPIDMNCLFYFSPSTCSIIIGGKKLEYDLNNPLCLIRYIYKNDEVRFYKDEDVLEYLNISGDINSEENRKHIWDKFVRCDDKEKRLLIYGNKILSSTFDIIEEK